MVEGKGGVATGQVLFHRSCCRIVDEKGTLKGGGAGRASWCASPDVFDLGAAQGGGQRGVCLPSVVVVVVVVMFYSLSLTLAELGRNCYPSDWFDHMLAE